jgi:hypothetical protein
VRSQPALPFTAQWATIAARSINKTKSAEETQ